MTDNELVLVEIKAAIFDMPVDEQQKVQAAIAEFRKVLSAYPDGHAHLALAYVGAELS